MRGQENGTPFSVTATHATGAVATKSGTAGLKSFITDISGSSDKAGALLLVKDGTTTIWQEIIGATTPYHHSFAQPLSGSVGADISITVDGTSLCKSNVAGYTL